MRRYLAEFKTGAERKDAAESTLIAYKSAQVGTFSSVSPLHYALISFLKKKKNPELHCS